MAVCAAAAPAAAAVTASSGSPDRRAAASSWCATPARSPTPARTRVPSVAAARRCNSRRCAGGVRAVSVSATSACGNWYRPSFTSSSRASAAGPSRSASPAGASPETAASRTVSTPAVAPASSTAAARSTASTVSGIRSSLRSSTARTPLGTGPGASTPQVPSARSRRTISAAKNGLPPVRRCSASATSGVIVSPVAPISARPRSAGDKPCRVSLRSAAMPAIAVATSGSESR